MNSRDAEERNLSLSFKAFGREGPPWLILHGLFGSSRNWRGFALDFQKEFRIWTFDQRNHGDSPHASRMDYPLMAGDVRNFADSHELSKFGLLGHSMGGKTAMQLALDVPTQIRFLIVVDIAPVHYTHQGHHRQLISVMKQTKLNGIKRMNEAEAMLKDRIPDPVLRKFLMLNLKPEKNGMKWRLGLEGIDASLNRLLEAPTDLGKIYEGPTLFIGGEKSNYLHPSHHPEVRRFFPNSRIVMLKKAGHWIHAEQPEAFRKTVKSFLDAVFHLEKSN